MSVAANLNAVKERTDRYLWVDTSSALAELREFVVEHILPFRGAGILGGLIRELARTGKVGVHSDVDFVIDAPAEEVSDLAVRLGATANRFGGFGYKHPLWKIDFWALETTWVLRHGYVTINQLGDVRLCTFFDCDSIFYDLKSRDVIADAAYIARLKNKLIDINLLPNPSILGNLVRAVRRILYWSYSPGPALQKFISENLDDAAMREIVEIEKSLYGSSAIELFSNTDALKRTLFSEKRGAWLKMLPRQ